MLERAKETTREGQYTYVEYVRWADDLVILVDAYQRHDWLLAAVDKRLREELELLQVAVNEDKSRMVDLAKGDSFGFLGFEFRRVRSLRGVWRPQYSPQMKTRSALLRKLKKIFRRYRSQPVGRVVEVINPILRGWVNYFAIGHSSRCFGRVRNWVEKKIRRHMMRAKKRQGFGWKRWSRSWLYERLGLYGDYRVRWPVAAAKALPEAIGRITLDVKQAGKRSAGKPHAAFDEAGAGNVIMGAGLRTNAKVVGLSTGPYRRRASPRPYQAGVGPVPCTDRISGGQPSLFSDRCPGLEPEDLDAESAPTWRWSGAALQALSVPVDLPSGDHGNDWAGQCAAQAACR